MIKLQFGNVTEKKINTPNDFVSHMIEHIAWRLGCKIELEWDNEDWKELGKALGEEITKFEKKQDSAAALGMIDDGSAEVAVDLQSSGVEINSSRAVDQEWFLNSRCEQVDSGRSLVDLLEGLAQGLEAKITVTIGNVEDQHHTWEGIYRAVGISLSKIFTPEDEKEKTTKQVASDTEIERNCSEGEISVLERSINSAVVRRGTAETGVTVGIDFTAQKPNEWNIDVSDSIIEVVTGMDKLLAIFTQAAGITMRVDFKAKVLSASHVVTEDIGMVAGKAFIEVLKLRMNKYGMNSAGSNVQTAEDIENNSVNVGISVEGRKCWRFVPFDGDYQKLKKEFLIGQDVMGKLRSEDLDDFIDGLSGGLTCSIVTHLKDYSDADQAWQEVFKALGEAVKEAFEANPYRQGVPAGVKATLA